MKGVEGREMKMILHKCCKIQVVISETYFYHFIASYSHVFPNR